MKHLPLDRTTDDITAKLSLSYEPHETIISNNPYRPYSPYQQEIYNDLERYGIISDTVGKVVRLSEDNIKMLAQAVADKLIIPITKEIVVPVSKQVAEKIIVPVGKHVATEIALPVGKYVAKEIVLPVGREVAKETKDITMEAMKISTKFITDLIKTQTDKMKEDIKQEIKTIYDKVKALQGELQESIKQEIESIQEKIKTEINAMQNKLKEIPSEIMQGIKSSIKLPWTIENEDGIAEFYNSDTYMHMQPSEEMMYL